MKPLRDLLPLLAIPPVLYSFIVSVLNEDIHVFLGVARIADFFGSFPLGVDISWDSKPIGNRLIFYLLEKVVQPVIGNEFLVQVETKAIAAAIGLIICAYFAIQVSRKLKSVNVYWIFVLTSLAVLTLHTVNILQAEFTALLMALFAMGLLLSNKKYAHYLAGAVMLGIILVKLITVVFIPLIIITWFLTERYLVVGKLKRLLYGFLVASGFFVVSCVLWFHNFVGDTLLLLSLGHPTGMGIISQIILLVLKSPGVIWYIPVLFPGLIATVLLVRDDFRVGNRARAVILLVSWVFALAIAFIQVEFWIYQYLPLVIPALTAMLLLMESRGKDAGGLFLAFVGIMFIVWFVACSVWVVPHQGQWSGFENDKSEILTNYPSITGQEVLYLDAGDAPYYFGAPSACRYIFPVVIQRATNFNPGLAKTDAYRDEMSCINSYSGEFIIINSGWFGTHEPVNSKINDEYVLEYQGSQWELYKRTG